MPNIKIPSLKKIQRRPSGFLGILSDYRRYITTLVACAQENGADFSRIPKPMDGKIEEWFIKLEKTILDKYLRIPQTESGLVVLRVYCPTKAQKKQLAALGSWISISKSADQHGLQTEFIELTQDQFDKVKNLPNNLNVYATVQTKMIQTSSLGNTRKLQLAELISQVGSVV